MPVLPFPDIAPALSEIILAAGAMALLIFGAITGEKSTRTVSWLAIAVLILALFVSLAQGGERHLGFYGVFVTDAFALFMKALVLIGSAVTILMGMRYNEDQGLDRFEFPVLVLLSTTGMMVMISANDLITLYVGLELQNLALYVVAAFNRDFDPVERGRAQIFRAQRTVIGNAALRRFADLRVYRYHRIQRNRHSGRRRGGAFGRCPHWPRFRRRRPRLQSLGGAVPYVDARRL